MPAELVTFKMEKNFLEEVDATVKNSGFQSRTEFIRNALREKVEELKLKQAMMNLSKFRGASKIKTTDEERERIREKVFREFEKKIM
ncbi:MAG: ribbon-helix-helix domain-containing protein [Nanoarchaeota archaeon]